jgi:poly-gamma-glutamate synthesis protein (capsule biosynthesis protein)
MLQLIAQAGLEQVGGGMHLKQAHSPRVFQRHGLRIAVLSYNEFHPRSFEAGHNLPGVAWSEDQQVVSDIRTAKQRYQADLVIPIMHWGWENERQANPRQRYLAQRMVDAGADAVIGGHPHVTQDIAIYKGKPIVFSVGNFVMKETDNAYQRQGWLLKLHLDKRGVTGFETLPVSIDLEGLPTVATETTSPCWKRGDKNIHVCDTRK